MQGNVRLSKLEAVSGRIKEEARDFIVEEIARNGTVLEENRQYSAGDLGMEERDGRFSTFVMQKENWNTVQACRAVARKLNRGIKSVGFAGTKDRRAVSTQLCSLYGATPQQLMGVHVKDISINGAWKSDSAVSLGDLLGNRFRIRLKTMDEEASEKLSMIHEGIRGIFPNYFGAQRFGVRGNNVLVGRDILKGDFEGAAMRFLTDSDGETNASAIDAREKLKHELDFGDALSYFPRYLKYELRVIEYLSMYPSDFANAIRQIPRQITLMFVHSVESYIFNRELEMRIGEGELEPMDGDLVCPRDGYGFPDLSRVSRYDGNGGSGMFIAGNIVGYDTASITPYEQSVMDELNISASDFMVRHMPELNCKGQHRVLFAPYRDFSFESEENALVVRFSLPAGSYATSLLSEFANECEPEE